MNDCLNIYELIQKELDGDLTSHEKKLLNNHCQNCKKCQSIREDFLQIEELILSTPLLDPGADFYGGIMSKLEVNSLTKRDFHLSKLTSIIAAMTILLSSGMLFIGWLFLLPIVGFSLYMISKFYSIPFLDEVLGFLNSFIYYSSNALSPLAQIFNPSFMGIIMIISFASLIILLKLLSNNREDYQI